MATITDVNITNEINRRVRPRAESILGLNVVLADDYAVLSAVAAGLTPGSTVIDDGVPAPIPFTNDNFIAYTGLLNSLLTGGHDPDLQAAIAAAKVRPIDLIVSLLARSQEAPLSMTDIPARMLFERIRPRAKLLRKLNYEFANDIRVLGRLLSGLSPTDIIDDNRAAEGIAPLTVSQVNKLVAFAVSAVSADVNTTDVADAIDAACDTVLEVL